MIRRISLVLGFFLIVPAATSDEAVVFIVHRTNPVQSISQHELADIYSGQTSRWPDGQKIVAVNQPVDSSARAVVYRILFNAPPGQQFSQPGSPAPFKTTVRPSDRSVKQLVSRLPNAIGYARASTVDERIKVLVVDGPGRGGPGFSPGAQKGGSPE
jgi:ABC-type phosphate transport system substrate-binding protein